MGCPCANPPGKGGKPVPRNPMTLKPLSSSTPLSRNDIRNGRVKREISEPIPKIDEEEDSMESLEQKKQKKFYFRPIRPMGGFLSDTMRKR